MELSLISLVRSALLFSTVSSILYYFTKHGRYYWLAFQLPWPHICIPPILTGFPGLAYKFDAYQLLRGARPLKRDLYAGWFPKLTVVVQNPEYISKIFTLTTKSVHYDGLNYLFGDANLISCGADYFKKTKQIFLRGFHGSSQEIIMDKLHHGADNLVAKLEREQEKAGDGWIKLQDYMKVTTADNIFGGAMDGWIPDDHPIYKVIENADILLKAAMLKTTLTVIPILGFLKRLNPFHNLLLESRQVIWDVCNTSCTEKKLKMEELERNGEEIPNQFIYHAMRERADDPIEHLHADIITLAAAALDTSATLASATLVLLGMYPEIQEKVFQEDQRIQEELGGRKFQESDFVKYEYLHRVIKEALRLYSAIPVVARQVPQEMKLGKYTIPKGCTVAIFLPDIHRNREIYPNPSQFDPDRFLPENVAKRNKYDYMPFGHGQRQCPGSRYGTQSAIFIVSAVIRKFEVFSKYKSVKELDRRLAGFFTISEKGKFPAKLKLRTK